MTERLCIHCQKPTKRYWNARMCWACLDASKNPKARAMVLVRKAVSDGDMPSPLSKLCVDCGAPAHFYDHRDYARPLAVEPLCNACNVRRGPGRWAA